MAIDLTFLAAALAFEQHKRQGCRPRCKRAIEVAKDSLEMSRIVDKKLLGR